MSEVENVSDKNNHDFKVENHWLKTVILNLKTKHERDALEYKIKTLELENETQRLKHDLENKVNVLKAQLEVQSLKHGIIMTKLKNGCKQSSEAVITNQTLINNFEKENLTLKHEIDVLKMEMRQKEFEFETKTVTSESIWKDENHDLKHQIEMMSIKAVHAQKEATYELMIENERLRKVIEDLKLESEELVASLENDIQNLKEQIQATDSKKEASDIEKSTESDVQNADSHERFFVGAERFFESSCYENWYKDMTVSLDNKETLQNEHFCIIRKDFFTVHESLYLVSKRKTTQYNEEFADLIVEGLSKELWDTARVIILHPTDIKHCLEMTKGWQGAYYEKWLCKGIGEDVYYQTCNPPYSALVLIVLQLKISL
uniref:Uncharacterized protein n=1 Tax=Clytia hemisphaerica TaxID=252671 RepID=A0A7M5TV30_9CNID